MGIYGYAGSILYVDLTSRKIRKESLSPELAGKFLGGYGINMKLFADNVPAHAGPLSPENALVIGTGPFPGTMIPSSSRTYITFKHPLSGTVGSAPGTGVFSMMLKSAGYDHVVITGKAMKPVYLKISEYSVELCDASLLWGKDTYDTVFALRSQHEPCSVIAIGPAGENLVKISVTNIDSGQGGIGEGGLPAVMGSKNLKAVVAIQGEKPVRVAHARRLQKATDEVLERVRTYPRLSAMREGGGWYMMRGGIYGSNLVKKPQEEIDEEAAAFEEHKRSRHNVACACCPVACRERIDVSREESARFTSYHSLTIGHALNMFGSRLDYSQLVRVNDIQNRYGIDRIFFTDIMEWLYELYDEGAITSKTLGGLELKRDYDCIMKLNRMIAYRQGFGDTIADGIVSICNKLGLDSEKDAVHIKGWNHIGEPRVSGMDTHTFSKLVEPRGPIGSGGITHPPAYQPKEPVDRWRKYAREQGISPEAEERIFSETSFNAARLTKWMQSYFSVLQSLGFCGRLYITRFHDLPVIAEYYAAVTGNEVSPAGLLKAGERNWNMLKLLNVREGFSRKDDRPPEPWFEPLRLKSGQTLQLMDYYQTKVLTREDMAALLDEYYDECGWDKRTTAPTVAKLRELGLENAVA